MSYSFDGFVAEEGGPNALDVVVKVKEKRLVTGSSGVTVGNNEGTADVKVCKREREREREREIVCVCVYVCEHKYMYIMFLLMLLRGSTFVNYIVCGMGDPLCCGMIFGS